MSRPDETLANRLRRIAVVSSFVTGATAILALFGWAFDFYLFSRLLPDWEETKPQTAMTLLMGAFALWLLLRPVSPVVRRMVQVLAVLVILSGLIGIWEHVVGREFGLSRLFDVLVRPGAVGGDLRMAPTTALSFIFLGLALLVVELRSRQDYAFSPWLCAPPILMSLMAFLGYAYGVQAFYQAGYFTAMAFPTAVGVLVLACGIICARPDRKPALYFAESTLGGYVSRRLIAAAVLIPPAVGWWRLIGERAGYFETEFGVALFALVSVMILTAVLLFVAERLGSVEERLQRQTEINRTVINTAPAALFLMDPQNRVTFANPEAESMFGWSPKEFVGGILHEKLHSKDRNGRHYPAEKCPLVQAASEGRSLRDHEDIFFARNGQPINVLYSSAPLPGEEGSLGSVVVVQDITRRKLAEETLRRSEAEFRAIFELSAAGVALANLEGRLIAVNRKYCEITGYSEGELLEKTVLDITHPDDRAGSKRFFAQVLRGEISEFTFQKRYLHQDGHHIWVEAAVTAIPDAEGKPASWLAVVLDITEQKHAAEALHLAVKRFETLANMIPQFVWSASPEGDHDYFNERWYDYTGMPRAEDQGWKWTEYLHPDDVEGTVRRWRHSLATGDPYEVHYRYRRASDGAYRWFIGRALPIRDREGRITRWFGTSTDIEEQRREEEKLEALVEERTVRLRETVGELEHFSYTITHDMRAPLRAMQAFGQILRDEYAGKLDEAGQDFLRRIIDAAVRMDHLITDALNYSKVVQSELTLEPVDPLPLLRGIIDSYLEFQAPRAEVEIVEPCPWVMGNQAGLTQCFSNLLNNAVKFVEPGQVPRVRVRAEERGARVRLWFEDNGIGIPEGQTERIFQMFQRLNRDYEGTGIGLALVRKVVERMRGTVGAESEPGHGSRFWIELAKYVGTERS